MIYTVTLNPSLDYIMHVEKLVNGEVNRSGCEQIYAGGKGINVSFVLKALDIDSVLLGFTAGFTGRQIKEEVRRAGCREEFIELAEGNSRINVKLKSGHETEVNGQGPYISGESLNILFNKLKKLKNGDILVLAGNAPASLGNDIYAKMMEVISGKDVLTIVDASGEQLINALKMKPFLVKPNVYELSEIFGTKIDSNEEITYYAQKLCEMGAQNVIVSMDRHGGVIINDSCEYYCKAKEVKAVNSTGAGDSLVAGFIAKYLECGNKEEAFRFGIATGTAAASCECLPTREEIMAMC